MPVPAEYVMSMVELENLVRSGSTERARLRIAQLVSAYQRMKRSRMLTDAECLDLLGFFAQNFKKMGQPEMALSWFEELCDLALRLVPNAEDTAWDLYHLAECFESLGRIEESIKALQLARNIPCPESLANKIDSMLSRLSRMNDALR
jgi:tetratricopeptide (TPR) repeat protein